MTSDPVRNHYVLLPCMLLKKSLRTLPIAIGCGNCFIIKPSEKVPLTLMRMAELLKDAGLPAGEEMDEIPLKRG